MSGSYELPMFPLGTVLFPSAFLPLHVFEPRYRALTADVLAGESREFGVVLIERGHEVGGGDVRADVGTVARVIEAQEAPDGRWALAAVGLRRVEVEAWLPDDPYPRARVADLDDADDEPVAGERLDDAVARLRRLLGRLAELGEPVPSATFELADDPALATFQLGALAPFGAFDRQQLLRTPGATGRLALVEDLLTGVEEIVEHRLRDPEA